MVMRAMETWNGLAILIDTDSIRRLGASPSQYSRRLEVMTMTVLDLLVLAEVLMRLMSRIIEIFLMIRDALQTRKGKERSQ
ncbi:hypothetical protein C1861_06255 [Eggerthella lenta]|nr:hypothetical protein C1861_06255 [Eggerthella lenta]